MPAQPSPLGARRDHARGSAPLSHGTVEQALGHKTVLSQPSFMKAPVSAYSASIIGTRNRFNLRPEGGALRIGNFFNRPVPQDGPYDVWVRSEEMRIVPPCEGLSVQVEAKLYQGSTTRLFLQSLDARFPQVMKLDGPSAKLQNVVTGQNLAVAFDVEGANVFAN